MLREVACPNPSRRFQLQSVCCLLAALPARGRTAAVRLRVELPATLQRSAGQGMPSPVRAALVEAHAAGDGAALLLAMATSDAGHASSLALARHWHATVAAAGCAIAAVDPDPMPDPAQDTLALRDALLQALLAALPLHWPGSATAPLLLAGFSGGAKVAASLAALLAARGRAPAGLYLSGANETALPQALRRLHAGARQALCAVPVFLHAGDDDRIAPPARQRALAAELGAAGFVHLQLHVAPGGHAPDVAPLRDALAWFARQR